MYVSMRTAIQFSNRGSFKSILLQLKVSQFKTRMLFLLIFIKFVKTVTDKWIGARFIQGPKFNQGPTFILFATFPGPMFIPYPLSNESQQKQHAVFKLRQIEIECFWITPYYWIGELSAYLLTYINNK